MFILHKTNSANYVYLHIMYIYIYIIQYNENDMLLNAKIKYWYYTKI